MKYVLILVSLVLTGCVTPDPVVKVEIQEVKVPVAIPCKTSIPTRPDFNFDKLTKEDDLYRKTQSLLADRKLYQGYEIELLAALKSCM